MAEASGRLRGVVLSLLLACFSVGVVLGVGEIVARATWRDPEESRPRNLKPLDPSLPELKTLKDLIRPNVRGRRRGVLHETNSLGVRGPEYTAKPQPGVFRIAIGGDSVTMGSGVDAEQAYPTVLEERLNAADDDRRYEVINLGISGLDIRAVMRRVQRIGGQYAPHLVVYGYTINDIEGGPYKSFQRDVGMIGYRKRYQRFEDSPSYLWRMVWPRLLTAADLVRPPQGSYLHEILYNYFENPPAWERFETELAHFARLAKERDVCVHVFLHTQLTRLGSLHPFRPVYDKVENAAQELGLTTSRPDALIAGVDENVLRISVWDPHPSALGHSLFAEALEGALRDLPERCWDPRRGRRSGRG